MVTAARFSETPSQEPLDGLLDRTYSTLARRKDIRSSLLDLLAGLGEIWTASSPRDWAAVVARCKSHALYRLLDQDPFTYRARSKPRGYAGDAVMIDYMYRGLAQIGPSVTTLGCALLQVTAGSSLTAKSVRARRDLLASRIDGVAARVPHPRILAVACGHLREAAVSSALTNDSVGLLCALDQDRESLASVVRDYGSMSAVAPLYGSVRDILRGKVEVKDFDFIYAASLYDYLPQSVARALTAKLASGLASGGSLLVGNFLPAPASVGFMEAMMDWSLIWRTQAEISSLVDDIPPPEIAAVSSFADDYDTIGYVEVTRR